jgi:NAD(P)-dependent dehydrogenase (short-subunit alcohol dehydrogenase family)
MDLGLTGRAALVTGGAAGIGAAVAVALSKAATSPSWIAPRRR